MRLLKCFVVAGITLSGSSAFALDPGSLSFVYGSGAGRAVGGTIAGDIAGRTWGSVASTGVAAVTDSAVARVGGATAAMTLVRSLPLSGVLTAAARAMPYLGAGLLAYQVYDAVRCKATSDGSSGLLCDPGTVQAQYPLYTIGSAPYAQTGASAGAVCSLRVSFVTAQYVARGDRQNIVVSQTDCTAPTATTAGHWGANVTWTTPNANAPGGVQSGGESTQAAISVSNQLACPPLQQGGASPSPGIDGKCLTGNYTPTPAAQAEALAEPYVDKSKVGLIAEQVAPYGDLAPLADPGVLTGPATAPEPQTQVQTHTDPKTGVTTTTTTYTVNNITYQGNTYSYVTTQTTTNPDGTTDTKTGQPAPAVGPTTVPTDPQPTCGLPGKPECNVKVDEAGTPPYSPTTDQTPTLLPQLDSQKRDAAMQSVQAPDFGFIGAPPIADCTPFSFPNNMGSLDPCGVVTDVRSVMAYLWALVAAWLCFGWIRQTVSA